ncbi:DUF262 domain-containing protein [Pseudomonas viridiflava]|uniref:DUF262 domain-containing protein n=1 Tax=Pseudomonas viridiflava TaxID=33069 RepID=UPI002EB028A5|nr:DUF262 domain-containing protein [Pseudomonas viridiflava]
MNPSQQLVTKTTNISELLKSTYFEVPSNQREYRWGKEQLEKMWDDILTTIIEDAARKSIGHFLGAIVVIGEEQSHDSKRWEIIDGQQRLTTITILSECLRAYIGEIADNKVKTRLGHVLLDCVVAPNSEFSPRLKLNREDEFYKNSLFENTDKAEKLKYWSLNFDKKSEVQANIKNAFEFFYKAIDEYLDKNPDYREDNIRNLAEALTESFYVLVVRTASLSLAYRLFETLNERGLDLSQADLIKNVLLEYAKTAGGGVVSNVTDLWKKFVDNYEDQPSKKLDLPQLIQFSYTYRYKVVKKEKIFESVSDALRSGKVLSIDIASEINKDSSNWRSFLLGDIAGWDEELADIQDAIADPLWKSHCASFIMAAMDKFITDLPMLKRCLTLAEHYLFRQGLAVGDSVGSMQDFFAEAAFMVKAGLEYEALVKFFMRKSSDDIFKDAFEKLSVSNVRQGYYVIWKIEKFINPAITLRPRNDNASQIVEHILPRKPGPEWQEIAKSDDYSKYLNRIGNLLILPTNINQCIKNKDFSYKCKNELERGYGNSGLLLPVEVQQDSFGWLEKGNWTFGSVDNRQKLLASRYALKVWSLDVK